MDTVVAMKMQRVRHTPDVRRSSDALAAAAATRCRLRTSTAPRRLRGPPRSPARSCRACRCRPPLVRCSPPPPPSARRVGLRPVPDRERAANFSLTIGYQDLVVVVRAALGARGASSCRGRRAQETTESVTYELSSMVGVILYARAACSPGSRRGTALTYSSVRASAERPVLSSLWASSSALWWHSCPVGYARPATTAVAGCAHARAVQPACGKSRWTPSRAFCTCDARTSRSSKEACCEVCVYACVRVQGAACLSSLTRGRLGL
jgi:hypothetical protein